MDGKKLVIGLFALVIIMSVITFTLYLLTRQIDDENGGAGVDVPNAVVVQYEVPATPL